MLVVQNISSYFPLEFNIIPIKTIPKEIELVLKPSSGTIPPG